MKQKGFTLIELLVVIVIIGILATISVATFSGYFAKARDSERQAAVRNTSTILKTARAVESITGFNLSSGQLPQLNSGAIDFGALLSDEGGYSVPDDGTNGSDYLYIYSADGDDFAVISCSEETAATGFIDGTTDAVAAATTGIAAICDGSAPVAGDVPTGFTGAIITNGVAAPADLA